MPRLRIIVLDQDPDNALNYNVLFWADVPTARQVFYTNPNAKSAWADATTADNQALQSGAVVEQKTAQHMPQGTNLAQIEAYLQGEWQKFQTNITNTNPWLHYGSTWDGTSWVITSNG